jgi:hypothetical protein
LAFRDWVKDEIKAMGHVPVIRQDNITVTVGLSPTTLFSCHMDTVGDTSTTKGERKKLTYDAALDIIALDKTSPGGSLGADDGVGVWIMLHMISQKVSGEYVFHVGEEVGCIGSRAMVDKEGTYLKKFEAAIAFDRPNDYEVITHQGGLRCASDKYGKALASALNANGMQFETSTKGVLTDTKQYRGLIAECINIGVGYSDQHSKGEWLNYDHALRLRDALCKVQWDALPVDRDPNEKDPVPVWKGNQRDMWGSPFGSSLDRYDFENGTSYAKNSAMRKRLDDMPVARKPPAFEALDSAYDELKGNKREDLMILAEDDPDVMVDTMIRLMREVSQLRADIAYMETMV